MNWAFIFTSVLAIASTEKAVIPETVVKISIFDLIQHLPAAPAKPAYQLPKGYGKEVAALVVDNKKDLTDCVSGTDFLGTRFELELAIASSGKAEAKLQSDLPPEAVSVASCVRAILDKLTYPKHGFSHVVTVEFPLVLQKKVL